MEDAFSWSFSLRCNGCNDDEDCPEGDSIGEQVVQDIDVAEELDLSAREDTAQFKPNPWSIAKLNSLSRQSTFAKPKAVQSRSVGEVDKTSKAPILEAFKKQAQKDIQSEKSIDKVPPSHKCTSPILPLPHQTEVTSAHGQDALPPVPPRGGGRKVGLGTKTSAASEMSSPASRKQQKLAEKWKPAPLVQHRVPAPKTQFPDVAPLDGNLPQLSNSEKHIKSILDELDQFARGHFFSSPIEDRSVPTVLSPRRHPQSQSSSPALCSDQRFEDFATHPMYTPVICDENLDQEPPKHLARFPSSPSSAACSQSEFYSIADHSPQISYEDVDTQVSSSASLNVHSAVYGDPKTLHEESPIGLSSTPRASKVSMTSYGTPRSSPILATRRPTFRCKNNKRPAAFDSVFSSSHTAFGDNDDLAWSTLPARKRPATSKNKVDHSISSGKFKLPSVFPSSSSSKQVVLYTPPPRRKSPAANDPSTWKISRMVNAHST